jgi:hemolysin activation/secretion protein
LTDPREPKGPGQQVEVDMNKFSIAILLSLLAPSGVAFAQALPVPPVPNAVLSLPAAPRTAQPTPSVQEQLQLPDANAPAIHIRAVNIIGNSALPRERIAAAFAGLIGTTAKAAQLREALDKIGQDYTSAGYALGRAFIPGQQMKNGVLTVRVLEGYVGAIVVQTDTPRVKDTVARYASALLASRPLRSDALDRTLRLIARIPGVKVAAKLSDMNLQTGAVALILTVDYRPITTSLALNTNSNVRGLPVQPYLTIQANDLLGDDDQAALVALLSPVPRDEYFLQASGSAAVGDDGWRVASITSIAKARANILPRTIDLSSTQLRSEVNASYPWIASTDEQLMATAGTYFSQLHYSLDGAVAARDRYVATYVELSDIRRISPEFSGSLLGRVTFGTALPYIPPQPQSRANATRDFAKLALTGQLAWTPSGPFSIVLRGDAQAASGSLTAGEEVSYGADRFGRGYDSGMVAGDHGIAASVQPQYSFALAPQWQAAVYVFGDYARVFNTPGDHEGDATLLSSGVGFSVSHESYSATLGVAEPLRTIPGYNLRLAPRLFGALQIKL